MPTALKKPVTRVANKPLDSFWGPDRERRLVITIVPGNGGDVDDVIELRPLRTKRIERIAVTDLYRYALACRVNCDRLKKAREKLAKQREAAKERKFRAEVRKINRGRIS